MSESPNTEVDDDKATLSPEELRYIPKLDDGGTTNTAHGNHYGLQAGMVGGDVTIYSTGSPLPDLVASRTTVEEIDEVRHQFVPPHGIHPARRTLNDHHVVVLCGRGSGRSFTARRLLVDFGCTTVIDMNRDRALHTVRDSDLQRGEGYIWDGRDSGATPFTDREFSVLVSRAKQADCRVVIILDRKGQAPGSAVGNTVQLTPPAASEVALAAIRWRCPEAAEGPAMVLKSELDEALDDADPPEKATRAAVLAIRVSRGELDARSALDELREDVDGAVARWFALWSGIEIPKAVAVALLEHHPYDEVVPLVLELDEQIRRAELAEDKKLRPRRLFTKSKEELLRDVRAVTVIRDHPKHLGLKEETVRFERQDWASAVLRHVWSEYPVVRAVLRDWMCGTRMLSDFSDATRRALCTIIAQVPAHDPLRMVDWLAGRHRVAQRVLAATTLTHLADDHNLLPLVNQTLEEWADRGAAYRQWTAAVVYGSPFGRRDTHNALVQLAKIGRTSRAVPQNAVVAGVLAMLGDQRHREHVLNTAVSWTNGQNRDNGLRPVSLSLGMWVTGFLWSDLDSREFGKSFPRQVDTLVRRVLADKEFGAIALSRLSDLADIAGWDEWSASELVYLATLITPNLRWWSRRRVVTELTDRHPLKRTEIRRSFRTARKVQRTMARA
jgi:hypothetical protein